jgi:hypothetical protein
MPDRHFSWTTSYKTISETRRALPRPAGEQTVSIITPIQDRTTSPRGRSTNPLQPQSAGKDVDARAAIRVAAHQRAIERRCAQLPPFVPLLEELEVAGWSSHRRLLGGNFHDWLLLESRQMLVTVGQAVGSATADPIEAALVAQSAWSAIRAHAQHVRDAGTLLSLVSHGLWPAANSPLQVAAAVALVDTAEGHVSLAIAGDCLAWRVRAASTDQLAMRQPQLGAAADFTYLAQSFQLSLRERLLLVVDEPLRRSPKLAPSIAAEFAQLDAETHRRMMASDLVAIARGLCEPAANGDSPSPASIVAVRRR